MSSSPLIHHTSPLFPSRNTGNREGNREGGDYHATPPSTPRAPKRDPFQSNPDNQNIYSDSERQTNGFSSSPGFPTSNLRTPIQKEPSVDANGKRRRRNSSPDNHHTPWSHASSEAVIDSLDLILHPNKGLPKHKRARSEHVETRLPQSPPYQLAGSALSSDMTTVLQTYSPVLEMVQREQNAWNASRNEALDSDRQLLDSAKLSLDSAQTFYHQAEIAASSASDTLSKASDALNRLRVTLGLDTIPAPAPPQSHVWDEGLSVAEKVDIMGLETAKTLSYGRCACWDPNCTLPREVKTYLKLHNLL